MQRRDIIRRHYEARVHPERDGYEVLDWASPEAQEARFLVLASLLPHAETRAAQCGRRSPSGDGCSARGATRPPGRLAGTQPPQSRADALVRGSTADGRGRAPYVGAAPRKDGAREPLQLLDVGCGLAELATYLEANHVPVTYTGVDLTPAVLHEAHRRRPGTALALADVVAAAPFAAQAFDVVYASGVFNLQLGNNDAFIRRALPRLFRLARRALVVNFLHRRAARQYPHCHYYDPTTVQSLLRRGVHRTELLDDYLENDFTVVYWR